MPGPSDERPDIAGQKIIVAVQKTGDNGRCVADLADDLPEAERIAAAWVEAGIKPEAVTALRATELPLKISYKLSVEINDHTDARSDQDPKKRAVERARPLRERATPAAAPEGKKSGVLNQVNDLVHDVMPEAPFQLRFDRIIWLGLWAASLFVLGILLVASLSGGNAREFVIGGQPQSSEDGSLGSDVTPAPTLAPSASPGVSVAAPLPACLQGAINNCQCQNFGSQGDAQKFFTAYPPPVRQPIDPDGDGFVCEWLPKIAPSASPGR